MTMTFAELGLSRELLQAVESMGFEEPTPIQVLAVPPFLAGRDVIGQAQTGTGKTAAFGLPLLEKVNPKNKAVQALVLCPTRELAIQVAEEVASLGSRKRGVFVLPIYGGQPIERQFRALERGAQIIVGTPGRVMDHLARGTMNLDQVQAAVLDEADEMLDMGFRDDIEDILEKMPEDCQKVFFSATMPGEIMDLSQRYLHAPEVLKIARKHMTVPTIEQVYYEVRPHQKMDALCRVLDSQGFRKALVFCSTKRGVDEVTVHLQTRGYQADGLHGNLAQPQRDRVMARFRGGNIEILVATDVAARGIDVEDVDAVINYDIPNDVENYVHRIGRTGRAGRAGKAFTFVTGRDQYRLRDIIRYTQAKIDQDRLPTLRDVDNIRTTRLLDEVRATIEAGALDRYSAIVERFLDDDATSMDMAAALLKLLMQRDFGSHEQQGDRDDLSDGRNKWREAHSGKVAERLHGKRAARGSAAGERGMTRLFLNVGSKMQVGPRDLVGAIAGECGIPGRSIGAIEIHDRFSFVDIPDNLAEEVTRIMNNSQIRGFRVAVEKAVPKH
ncbi:DEAD/DEAH box helicase [Desulfovibrio sp. OttesenSCG-928-M16]|nr:DEAD/DEAH box helicase [Desulfovibrio sp. OttesenSCG-928-M16]